MEIVVELSLLCALHIIMTQHSRITAPQKWSRKSIPVCWLSLSNLVTCMEVFTHRTVFLKLADSNQSSEGSFVLKSCEFLGVLVTMVVVVVLWPPCCAARDQFGVTCCLPGDHVDDNPNWPPLLRTDNTWQLNTDVGTKLLRNYATVWGRAFAVTWFVLACDTITCHFD